MDSTKPNWSVAAQRYDQDPLQLATYEWVSWFNHQRLLEPIGYILPAEAEANYYLHLAEQIAAQA